MTAAPFYIETSRLLLREFNLDDVDNLFAMDSLPIVHRYLGKNPIKNKTESKKYIQDCIVNYRSHGTCRLAIELKETKEFIGWSGLRFNNTDTFNSYSKFYDVGYRLHPNFWGKGYATEAGKASVKFGFNYLNLSAIYGITDIKNNASHKTLLKIGLNYIEDFKHKHTNLLRWYEIKNPKL